ncbi:unnamed protein product [Ectocarpus sp. 6 AP-2014]
MSAAERPVVEEEGSATHSTCSIPEVYEVLMASDLSSRRDGSTRFVPASTTSNKQGGCYRRTWLSTSLAENTGAALERNGRTRRLPQASLHSLGVRKHVSPRSPTWTRGPTGR